MNPTQHLSNNDVLRSPAGATIDECRPLAITRILYDDEARSSAVASFWRPTAEELVRLNEGKSVRLIVMGKTHPPLLIEVDGDGAL